jgi:hypothetical protein
MGPQKAPIDDRGFSLMNIQGTDYLAGFLKKTQGFEIFLVFRFLIIGLGSQALSYPS